MPVIPNPESIFCVGLNYATHVAETGRQPQDRPSIFLRTRSSQTAHQDKLIKPRDSNSFDFEGELAVIIGKGGRHIPRELAAEHIAGYSCYNDGTVRDWQRHTHQWTPGKNFEMTGSFGPWMVTRDEMPCLSDLRIQTRVNGQQRQNAMLNEMLFSVEEVISYISTFALLRVGDVIITGTPSGVGDREVPPKYLSNGDKVEVEIDQIGTLLNEVADE